MDHDTRNQNSEVLAEMTAAYKALAEAYLFGKFGVDLLDRRFAEYLPRFNPAPWRKEVRAANPAALTYISMLNSAHLERLSAADREEFERHLRAGGVVSGGAAVFGGAAVSSNTVVSDPAGNALTSFLERTYRTVLAGTTTPGAVHEYFADLHNRGTVPGNAIVFVFSDIATYDNAGNRDHAAEDKKTRVFAGVKRQFEAIAAETGDDVRLIRY